MCMYLYKVLLYQSLAGLSPLAAITLVFFFCFPRTKQMVIDVLRVQPGGNLTEVLNTPATPEQEKEHQRSVHKGKQEQEQLHKIRHMLELSVVESK